MCFRGVPTTDIKHSRVWPVPADELVVGYVSIAAVAFCSIGDAGSTADHVRYQRYSVSRLNIDLLRDLDRVVDLDADIPDRAFNLGMPEQELDSP